METSKDSWKTVAVLLAALTFAGLSFLLWFPLTVGYALTFATLAILTLCASFKIKRLWFLLALTCLILISIALLASWNFSNETLTKRDFGWIIAGCLWLLPLGIVLKTIFSKFERDQKLEFKFNSLDDALKETFIPSVGYTLDDLSKVSPLLIVFLRYVGCTFCKQTLNAISEKKKELEKKGFQIVLVHLNTPQQADNLFQSYGLQDLISISDPDRQLYHAFGLQRATLAQIASPVVFKQFFKSTLVEGYVPGEIDADPFQMPGVYIVYESKIIYAYYPKYAGDQPNFQTIANLNSVNAILQSIQIPQKITAEQNKA